MNAGDSCEHLTFEVDGIRCAVSSAAVVEVLRAVAVRPLPGQSALVAGVIDLRGTIVPVLDLRARFGRASRPMARTDQLIVAATRERLVALWVDDVIGLAAHHDDTLTRAAGLIVGTRSLLGVARTPRGVVMIHDIDAFITEAETDALAHAARAA